MHHITVRLTSLSLPLAAMGHALLKKVETNRKNSRSTGNASILPVVCPWTRLCSLSAMQPTAQWQPAMRPPHYLQTRFACYTTSLCTKHRTLFKVSTEPMRTCVSVRISSHVVIIVLWSLFSCPCGVRQQSESALSGVSRSEVLIYVRDCTLRDEKSNATTRALRLCSVSLAHCGNTSHWSLLTPGANGAHLRTNTDHRPVCKDPLPNSVYKTTPELYSRRHTARASGWYLFHPAEKVCNSHLSLFVTCFLNLP